MYRQIVASGIPLAAEITGDQPCRNTGGAQYESGRHGVVAAKALLGIEQELIHPVTAKPWRGQSVVIGLAAKLREQGGDQRCAIRMACRKPLAVSSRSRVASGWQLQVALGGLVVILWLRFAAANAIADRHLAAPLPIEGVERGKQHRARQQEGVTQGESPAVALGLGDHFVAPGGQRTICQLSVGL